MPLWRRDVYVDVKMWLWVGLVGSETEVDASIYPQQCKTSHMINCIINGATYINADTPLELGPT